MDQLTHTATGLFLSRAGFQRLAPQAPWVLMLAANVPDIDVITAAAGPLEYINYHRHITHALAAAPLMALVVVLLARAISRRPVAWGRLFIVALAGVLSHLLLDWTNIYGVRLLLPFSPRWYHLDWTSVIDLWIWAVFLVALAGPLLVRLVNSEIGARSRKSAGGLGFAVFALVFLALYTGGRGALHARALAVLESRLYQGETVSGAAALPSAANPLAWRGLVETPEAVSIHHVNLLTEFDPDAGLRFYKPPPGAAIEAATRTPEFQQFLRFARYPFWRVVPTSEPENGARVEVMDLRFGSPARPAFVATAIVNAQARVLEAWFRFGAAGPR